MSYMVMPLYERDLFSYVEKMEGDVDDRVIRQVALDMGRGLLHLHDLDIVHRDVKPENIVCRGNVGEERFVLCDFGNAEDVDAMSTREKVVGTLAYIAPEVITTYEGRKETAFRVGKPVDMYSLGVTLYVLATKTMPFPSFKTSRQIAMYVLDREGDYSFVDDISNRSEDLLDLLRKLLDWNPVSRITAREMLRHPFVTSSRSNIDRVFVPGLRARSRSDASFKLV